MSSSRDQILGQIARGLGRAPLDAAAAARVDGRLASHARNLVPARSALPQAERIELFIQWTKTHAATIERVNDSSSVPAAVADFLVANDLPLLVALTPEESVAAMPWGAESRLSTVAGMAAPVGVTAAFAGIAEIGALVVHSGPLTATAANFVPETHVVVLNAARVVGSYEDVWDMVREKFGPAGPPRAINFIAGPSRTGDIDQQLIHGAHGPRRLHVVLVDGD